MNKEMYKILKTNWNLFFVKKENTEKYELTTVSGERNLGILMHILEIGFKQRKVINQDWNIILIRDEKIHRINNVNDIKKEILLKKYDSFLPECDGLRSNNSYYKNDKLVQRSEIDKISMGLIDDYYIDELKIILSKVFNINKDIIKIE